MGRYTPQTPCAPRAARHPLRVCPAPRSLNTPHRKEAIPIDFCHIPVSIIKRSEGRSAVAAAAYRSGLVYGDTQPEEAPLVYALVTKDGVERYDQ